MILFHGLKSLNLESLSLHRMSLGAWLSGHSHEKDSRIKGVGFADNSDRDDVGTLKI